MLIANVENITCPIFASELHCIYFMIWLFFSFHKYKNILLDNFYLIWKLDHYIKPRGTIILRIDQNNCFWPRTFCIQAMQLELYDPHLEHICTDSCAIIFIKSKFHGIIIKEKTSNIQLTGIKCSYTPSIIIFYTRIFMMQFFRRITSAFLFHQNFANLLFLSMNCKYTHNNIFIPLYFLYLSSANTPLF